MNIPAVSCVNYSGLVPFQKEPLPEKYDPRLIIDNPKILKESGDFRGRLYIQINDFLESVKPGNSAKEIEDSFRKTFNISTEGKNIQTFTENAKKALDEFNKLSIPKKAQTLCQNSSDLIGMFLKYFGK